MADTPATLYSDIMTNLQANAGGGIQALPSVTLNGARRRQQISSIVLAAQASGSVIWVGRIPLFAALISIEAITDTSLGAATIAFGDAHNGNSAIYGAATTLTALNALTRLGPPTAQCGVPITTGYDYLGTLVTPTMPQTAGAGGFLFEDIIMTVGAAALPASGNLRVIFSYGID